ncbi:MAG: 50S ribosomal protein L20 [Candidatus Omnitrophota bacterium]
MTKVKHAVSSRKRRKRTLDATKGQRGSRSRLFKIAKEAARKSLIANYIDRKDNKGNFRALWITRISAACKAEGLSYSKFIAALKKAGIELNRKMIADLAMNDSKGFKALIKKTGI